MIRFTGTALGVVSRDSALGRALVALRMEAERVLSATKADKSPRPLKPPGTIEEAILQALAVRAPATWMELKWDALEDAVIHLLKRAVTKDDLTSAARRLALRDEIVIREIDFAWWARLSSAKVSNG